MANRFPGVICSGCNQPWHGLTPCAVPEVPEPPVLESETMRTKQQIVARLAELRAMLKTEQKVYAKVRLQGNIGALEWVLRDESKEANRG